MRLLTANRRAMPVVLGGALVAASVALAVTLATLSGGHGPASGAGAAAANTFSAAAPPLTPDPPSEKASTPAPSPTADPVATLTGDTTPRLIVPDVIASVPGGLTKSDLAKLAALPGVRATLPIDGAKIKITVAGDELTVLAAPAGTLRPWTPPATAADQSLWSDFARGDLITTPATAQADQLVAGSEYVTAARVRTTVTFGGSAQLGISGIDGIIDTAGGSKLGLVKNVAVLVNAPATNPLTLVSQVQAALGAGATVIRLVPVTVSTDLPVDDSGLPSGRPASYLALFQESAAQYCPGLSWTVLAAIGQIESADGQNEGPSTAGALGPMQFLPSTWAEWGIDGFGETGPPDIWNPYDAVPSAARMLCADGATDGSAGLEQAIFDYNHATWYVDEVLTLAGEYAAEYS